MAELYLPYSYSGCKGIVLIQDIINYYSIMLENNQRFKVGFIKIRSILITTSGGVRVGLKFLKRRVIRVIFD